MINKAPLFFRGGWPLWETTPLDSCPFLETQTSRETARPGCLVSIQRRSLPFLNLQALQGHFSLLLELDSDKSRPLFARQEKGGEEREEEEERENAKERDSPPHLRPSLQSSKEPDPLGVFVLATHMYFFYLGVNRGRLCIENSRHQDIKVPLAARFGGEEFRRLPGAEIRTQSRDDDACQRQARRSRG